MVLLGIDPHKDTHTVVVVVDQAGRQLDQRTVPAPTLGHGELVGWARTRWPDRLWAVEDCRHVTAPAGTGLLAAGERVVRVPPRLMAGARQAVRVQASPTRSTPWPSPAPPCASPPPGRPPRPGLLGAPAAGRPSRAPGRRTHQDDQPAALAPAPARPDLERATRRLPGPGLGRSTAWLAQAAADPGCVVQVRICQAQVSAIQALTDQIGQLDRQLRQRVAQQAPSPAQPARLRAADRGQAHR
jgi:transposase